MPAIVISPLRFGSLLFAIGCAGGCSFSISALPPSPDLAVAVLPLPDLANPPPIPDAAENNPPPPDLQVVYTGTLVLTPTNLVSQQEVMLTPQGTRDWAHWGYTVATDVDRKVGGASQIGNYTVVGTGTPTLYTDNLVGYNWTDGMPHPTSGGAQTSGVYLTALNSGFHLAVPAATTRRTLLLYVGGYHSIGRLGLLLSDASAAAISTDGFGNMSSKYTVQFRIDFAAGTPGQTLDITWVQQSGDAAGNVTLQAAALADATQ